MNAPNHLLAVASEPAQSLADSELLSAWIEDKDHDSFSVLVHRHAPLVMGVCRRQCRRCQDADDAFQATFLCLMRSAHKIRRPERLASWLHGTAYRTAVAARRRERDDVVSLVNDPPVENDPLMQIARRHELRILDEELSRLAEPYRSAIVLHWIDGLATADVADALGVTMAVIRGRLQRGRMQLEQRLRLRGVAAVTVMAALAAWPVDHASAAASADAFVSTQLESASATSSGSQVSPDNSHLESLLDSGTSAMTWTTTIGCTAALALAAVAATTTSWGGDRPDHAVFKTGSATNGTETWPTQLDASTNILAQQASVATTLPDGPVAKAPSREQKSQEKTEDTSAMDMMAGSDPSEASSLRATIEKKLLEPATFKIANSSIGTLAKDLREATGLPVVSDPRGVALAGEGQTNPSFFYEADGLPLQVALREMLRPAALRAVVHEDSLVITADTAELARRGRGTSHWINVDKVAAEKIEKALTSEITLSFTEEPLDSALRSISEMLELPIGIDQAALESIGLTPDTPVSADCNGVKTQTLLDAILNPLELTCTIERERLVVSTKDAVEENRLLRIYWLDGLGTWEHDFDSLMMSIQQIINPDTWDALGGPSTMAPLVGSKVQRPGLLISTTLTVHQQIETLLNVMRETYLGPDYLDPPPSNTGQSKQRGGGGVGGGGVGGGGVGGGGFGGGGGGGGGGMF